MSQNLGLDEALVSIKRPANLPVDLYYQIDECFGCPLKKLLPSQETNFVIGTKYKLQLEVREANTRSICKFSDISLSNHGHYQIDVSSTAGPTNGSFTCNLDTLKEGNCYLCPIAVLVCLLLAITLLEKLYKRFCPSVSPKNAVIATTSESLTIPKVANTQEHQVDTEVNNTKHEQTLTSPLELEDCKEDESHHVMKQNTVSSSRIESLDTFRGLTIAGMIFVNYGGAGYVFFEHKTWNGLTLADFVFPFFIFAMGASIGISTQIQMSNRVGRVPKSIAQLVMKICRRSLVLMALGLCLNSKGLNNDQTLANLRLTGVLQRFSVSYLIVALMYLMEMQLMRWINAKSSIRIPLLSTVACAILELIVASLQIGIYIYVTFYVVYDSDCPAGYTGPGGETEGGRYATCTGGAASWLDKKVFGLSHLYNDTSLPEIFNARVSHDPEGLLGYTTSIVLTMAGLQCGKIFMLHKSNRSRLLNLSQWFLFTLAASLSAFAIPVNKKLWSLSFISITGSCSFLVVLILYLLVDVYHCDKKVFLLRLFSSAVDATSHLQLLLRLSWAIFVWLLIAHFMASKRLFIKV